MEPNFHHVLPDKHLQRAVRCGTWTSCCLSWQPKATTRRNLVSIVTEEVHGGTALINYWNEALEALPSVARFPS